jgi:regulator of sirC expression with transglutaminase-like and TPR domain
MDLDTLLPLLAQNPFLPLDAAELAFAVAKDEYPHLDIESELAELASMANELRPRLESLGQLRSRVDLLCRYLFHDLGFSGNRDNYYDPRNSYLNDVLERRTGLPISLSIVSMAVGTRAGLEIFGVGAPGHFITKAVEGDEEIYFDPFNGGQILEPPANEIALFGSIPSGYLLQRILTNLKGSYQRLNDFARLARILGRLMQLNPLDTNQVRDYGTALLHAGRPGQAIDALMRYLDSDPDDADAVQALLAVAQKEISRWN